MRKFILVAILLFSIPALAVRTVIASKTPTRSGITWVWTAPDTVNGNSCPWGTTTIIMAQNTTAGALNIVLWAAGKSDVDMTSPNRTISIPANSQGSMVVTSYYQQTDGTVWIDAPTGVNIACFTSN